jgi:hypothetical protein
LQSLLAPSPDASKSVKFSPALLRFDQTCQMLAVSYAIKAECTGANLAVGTRVSSLGAKK